VSGQVTWHDFFAMQLLLHGSLFDAVFLCNSPLQELHLPSCYVLHLVLTNSTHQPPSMQHQLGMFALPARFFCRA
jgi:hypothetical protein